MMQAMTSVDASLVHVGAWQCMEAHEGEWQHVEARANTAETCSGA